MNATEAHEGIQSALKAELAKHWGQIASIESRVSRSEGYLRKFCRGSNSIPLRLLFESLEVLEVDPGAFLSKALGTRLNADDLLRNLEQPGREAPAVLKIEKATLRLEADTRAGEPAKVVDPSPLLAKILGCSPKEQRRRLRTAARYRSPDFIAAYLSHLDSLRYENPKLAAKLAETVAVDLIPVLACQHSLRLELQCKAITVFSAAHRLQGSLPTAARAARFALELARKHSLEKPTANLLLRSSYLLADHSQYQEALVLLRESFEIYFDRDARVDMGKVLITRGFMFLSLGDHAAVVRTSEKALGLLSGLTPQLRRWYLAAYQYLATASEQLGNLDQAERWLGEAVAICDREGSINRAKLIWNQGRIAFAKGEHQLAENHLRTARSLLDERAAPESALVSLDLTRTLLVRGKVREAYDLARQMAAFLELFRKDKIAQAAIAQYTRLALEGKLSLSLIDRIQPQLRTERTRRPGAPPLS